MTERIDEKELVLFLELLMPHAIELRTITELFIEKGVFSKDEFFVKRRQLESEYERGSEAGE
jgi:hypothetical protein